MVGLELIERLGILLRIFTVNLVDLKSEDIAQYLQPAEKWSSGR